MRSREARHLLEEGWGTFTLNRQVENWFERRSNGWGRISLVFRTRRGPGVGPAKGPRPLADCRQLGQAGAGSTPRTGACWSFPTTGRTDGDEEPQRDRQGNSSGWRMELESHRDPGGTFSFRSSGSPTRSVLTATRSTSPADMEDGPDDAGHGGITLCGDKWMAPSVLPGEVPQYSIGWRMGLWRGLTSASWAWLDDAQRKRRREELRPPVSQPRLSVDDVSVMEDDEEPATPPLSTGRTTSCATWSAQRRKPAYDRKWLERQLYRRQKA